MSIRLDDRSQCLLEQSGHRGTVVLVLILLAILLAMVGTL